MARLIDPKAATEYARTIHGDPILQMAAFAVIDNAPTVEAVTLEAYNELREMFIDYVCNGVPNAAPYCANACAECLNAYGWCEHNESCMGFSPKERMD